MRTLKQIKDAGGKITYLERITLRSLRSAIQIKKEQRSRKLERSRGGL